MIGDECWEEGEGGFNRDRSMRKFFAFVSLVGLVMGVLVFGGVGRSYACLCPLAGSPAEELESAAAVFAGEVVSVREAEATLGMISSADPTTVEFRTIRVWKGPSGGTQTLTTARSGISCGFSFVEGREYIVYSYDGSTVYTCSRTALLALAAPDLAELGRGGKPDAGDGSGSPAGGGCGLGAVTGSGVVDVSVLGLLAGLV